MISREFLLRRETGEKTRREKGGGVAERLWSPQVPSSIILTRRGVPPARESGVELESMR